MSRGARHNKWIRPGGMEEKTSIRIQGIFSTASRWHASCTIGCPGGVDIHCNCVRGGSGLIQVTV